METRERILAAARDLLRDPESSFSLRAVARQVGLSPMAIYRHFADLEDLLAALREEGHRRLMLQLQAAIFADTARERLRTGAEAYVTFALAEPDTYDLMFCASPARDALAQQAHRRSAVTFRILQDRIRDAIAEDDIPPDTDPEAAAIDLWATLHGLVLLHRSGRLGIPPEAFLRFAADTVERRFPPRP